jgi:peptidoglycan/LPS O-acetylase OafA/YrhL
VLRADEIGESDCEAIEPGLLAQPVNALTSLGYVVAGIVVLLMLTPQQRRGVGGLYALLLALIGIGSVIFHGPQTPGAKFLHDAPIAALLVLIAVIIIARWRGGRKIFPGVTRRRVIALAVTGGLAGLSFLTGRTESPVCDPDSPLQPHGGWHVLTAVAFVLVAALLFRPPRPSQPLPLPESQEGRSA